MSTLSKRLLVLTLLLLALGAVQIGRYTRVIGTIEGAEWQRVTLGETTYHSTFDSGVTISRRGRFLGLLTDREGGVCFRAYAVKGDPQARYLYCLWDWEGRIYERD